MLFLPTIDNVLFTIITCLCASQLLLLTECVFTLHMHGDFLSIATDTVLCIYCSLKLDIFFTFIDVVYLYMFIAGLFAYAHQFYLLIITV